MGWAYGEIDGREVGYGVAATCDEDGCDTQIDRGLAYCCGGMHGGAEDGCGRYFCGEHLLVGGHVRPGSKHPRGSLCAACLTQWEAENPDPCLADQCVMRITHNALVPPSAPCRYGVILMVDLPQSRLPVPVLRRPPDVGDKRDREMLGRRVVNVRAVHPWRPRQGFPR